MSVRTYGKAIGLIGVACAVVLSIGACSSDQDGASQTSAGSDLVDVSEGANPDDVMFAQMMIPHHEQAVVMADIADSRAQDDQIRTLAAEIKGAQDPEIVLMQSWLDQWDVPRLSGDQALQAHGSHGMDGMLSNAQLDALANAEGATFDALFAQYMIEHHLGAISMAQDVLDRGSHPNVAALAREIIVTQEQEITQLQAFLSGESTGAMVEITPAIGHVHGAVVDGDSLLIGTHDGVHRVDPVTGTAIRVGESRDDLMAFTGDPSTLLLASGHPGPGSDLPNPLGLVTSTDGGDSWTPVSLTGQVDFHSLAVQGDEVVGWDTRGPLQWSTDGGGSWQPGPATLATSLAWFNDTVWVASPETGLGTWEPGSTQVPSQEVPSVLLAASDNASALWRLDGDGTVHRTLDGVAWEQQGRVSRVEALAASEGKAYVITGTTVETIAANAA